MIYLYYLIMVVLALGMKLGISDLVAIKGVTPDFVLIALSAISMYEGRGNGTIWGLATGFVEDTLSSGLLGAHALTRTLVSFFAGSIMSYRTLQSAYNLYASLTVGVLSLINNVILYIVVVQGGASWFKGLLMSVFFPALYTTFWALIIFSIVPDAVWERIYKTEPTPFI